METKTGDEAANLNINMTPETELKPKDSQSACKVIVQGISHMYSTLTDQLLAV